MLPNDNVSMSVGHIDHVLIVYTWLFTARWSTWPGNHLVPCVAELVGSGIPIHVHQCLPDPKCLFYPSGLSLCFSVDHFCLVGIPIHAHRCFPDPKCPFYPSGLSLCLSVDHFCLVPVNDMVLFHGMVCDMAELWVTHRPNSQVSHHRPCRGR